MESLVRRSCLDEPYVFTERMAKGLIELRREALLALAPDEEPALERLVADRAMRRALTDLPGRSNGPFWPTLLSVLSCRAFPHDNQ
ncbi:hypothetical protein [Streptomyces pseudovenezuelae]|uniref:hypothetical protein n=1 Tax=Streptomyces pseudovenezuelae TaxID=67350 RepID=UPI003723A44F